MTITRRTGIARKASVCAAPGCRILIRVGDLIARRPEGSYKHEDCARPGRPRKSGDRR
jgi:hypothetical protein